MLGVLQQYNGDSLYLAASAVSVGLLYLQSERRGDDTGKKAVAAILLAVVCIFNGAAYKIMDHFTDAATYYRFFWMLPVVFLVAYQVTEALFSGQKKRMAISLAALLLCLGVGSNFFISRDNLHRPKNIYGLAPDTITVADAIMEDWGEKEGNPIAAFDMYLIYQVRTYEPRILWGLTRDAYLYYAEHGYDQEKYARQQRLIQVVNEGIQIKGKVLERSLKKAGIDYLVIRTEFGMDSYLEECSVLPVARSETYTVYKVSKDDRKDI